MQGICFSQQSEGIMFHRIVKGRIYSILSAACLVLGLAQPASADTYSVVCSNCLSSSDFVASAVSAANGRGAIGIFVVMSQTYSRTAIVRVTGTVKTRIRDGAPEYYVLGAAGAALDESGAAITEDKQFEDQDQKTFGGRRTMYIKNVKVSANYAGSFVGSLDQ